MKKAKSYILSLTLGLCVILSAIIALPKNEPSVIRVSAIDVISEQPIQARYEYNAYFTIPNAKLQYNGQNYDALSSEAVLKFPDGKIVNETNFYLNQAGEYTVIYQTKANGTLISGEKKFMVNKGLYTFSNMQSSVTYNESLPLNQKVSGVTVSLAKGDTLQFNEAIDLTDTDTDVFDIIKLYPYTFTKTGGQNGKQQECSTIVMRLTDCYNSKIYVDFAIAYRGGHTYYRVRSNTQKYSGLTKSDKPAYAPRKVVFIDDERYVVMYDDDFGATRNVDTLDNIGLTFSINPNDYKCYATETSTLRISDLMSADIYGKYDLFGGFTTGEVYMSIFAEDYVTDFVHFDIEQIGNYYGSEVIDRIYSDVVAPKITVLATNDVKQFNVAINQKVKLFSATASDANLVGGVNTYVYYKYGTEAKQQVLLTNGEFTPNKLGDYTVVYSAKDMFGNVGREYVTFTCVTSPSGKNVDFNIEMPTSIPAGETTVLPAYTVSGLNGDVDVKIKAVLLKDNSQTEISTLTREFMPKEIGKYKIVFTCTDNLASEEFSYEITAEQSSNVIVDKNLALPKYFIKGLRYSVDEVKVTLFNSSQATFSDATFMASFDGGDYQEIEFDDFMITANESVRFKIAYQSHTLIETESYKVFDTGLGTSEFSHAKYFYSDVLGLGEQDFTFTSSSQNVLIKANKPSGDAQAEYISPLMKEFFNFDFTPVKDKSNFGSFEIILTDYYDDNSIHTITLRNATNVTYVSFDGGQETRMEKLFSSKHTVEYDVKTSSLIINKAVDGGAKFYIGDLFINEKIFFGFKVKDISGESEVTLHKLFKQNLSNTKAENSVPQIKTTMPSSVAKINSVVTLNSAIALDMFSHVLTNSVTVKVLAPNGEPITSNEGVLLDGTNSLANREYTFECDSYGVYAISYVATDQSGSRGVVSSIINVEDDVSPTIKLLDGYQNGCIFTVGKGSTVKIAGYEVQDNFGADKVKTYVMVYDLYGAFVTLTDEGTFVANRVGTWQVVYTAFDEIGNYSSARYSVVVK